MDTHASAKIIPPSSQLVTIRPDLEPYRHMQSRTLALVVTTTTTPAGSAISLSCTPTYGCKDRIRSDDLFAKLQLARHYPSVW